MKIVTYWIPAFLMMALIFLASSQPSSNLPDFDLLDKVIKKGGHMLGYGVLALAYLRGLRAAKANSQWRMGPVLLAWLFALVYALTDEYHQSFVAGRYASIWDIIIFDNLGALIALLLYSHFTRIRQPTDSPQ